MNLAVAGKARALVSGDRDLLAIAGAFEQASGCPILGLEAFSRRYLDV
jgi:predicted nucleic acid-binding protein